MKLLRWFLLTLFMAICLHIATVWYAPSITTRTAINMTASALAKSPSTPFRWNALFHGSLLEATGFGSSGFGSPDIIYSFAAYDVSQGPIRIHCVIPTDITYWSVSFYDMNSQNFFVENSLAAQSSELDLILAAQGVDSKLLLNEKVITSSTNKGMIAIRAVISDRNNKDELERISAAQNKSFIKPII
jgi:uncharacterized membrane protein